MTPQTDAERIENLRSKIDLALVHFHGNVSARKIRADFERLVRADERAALKMNKADKCITEHFRKRTKLR